MLIIPAIDLKDKQCVRLYKGDFNQKTVYSDSPIDVAKQFESEGATHLHIVDLDGAKDSSTSQEDLIIQVANNTELKIQTGGGIRDKDKIKKLLDSGISRVVIGSMAIQRQKETLELLEEFGSEKIVLALDVNIVDGTAFTATNGWQKTSELSLNSILDTYNNRAKYVLCTDISKDGALVGTNIDLYKSILEQYKNYYLIASGGVSSLSDLQNLIDISADACVVGKALYEKKFTVTEAISLC